MEQIFLGDLISQISIALDAVEADLLNATRFHSKRVGVLCIQMGKYLGYTNERLFSLAGSGLLHDNALTEYILSEYSMNDREINLLTHCRIGQNNAGFFPFPSEIDDFILYHHESADGSGAFGKKEHEFPEEAGLIALADQIDVQFSLNKINRSGLEKVRDMIQREAGRKFLPKASEAALAVLDDALLERLCDNLIFDTLKMELPEVNLVLSDREILRLSGIIAKIIDYKSLFTGEHSTQIANKAWYMSGIYGYSDSLRSRVYLAAALHDIGKLFIPTAILEKPGSLTDDEYEIIKSHALSTWEVLHSVRGFESIAIWASSHHEKLDGRGYPFGKRDSDLDFISRLLACLDIYQAVREKRPYHAFRSHEDTMNILYDMAKSGYIDLGITRDLDEALMHLEDGFAPSPKMMA